MQTALLKVGAWNRDLAMAVGSALRRYLLSSVKGTAVTAMRIKGVPHEYCQPAGVKENVLQIMRHLRALVVAGEVDGPTLLPLTKDSPGQATAADFGAPEGISFPDPAHHIAAIHELTEAKAFQLEAEIRTGTGYRAAQDNRLPTHAPGTIQVDTAFSPVSRAWFELSDGEATVPLQLGIETNGAVSPGSALAEAAAALAADLGSPFELEEFDETEGRFTSHWLPRGRATTLGNLLEAAILFGGEEEALSNVDVSHSLEDGDFLDNPDEERLVLEVKVVAGAPPRERVNRALTELAEQVRGATSAAEESSAPPTPALLSASEFPQEQRRFEQTPSGLPMPEPLAMQKEGFARLVDPDPAKGALAWLLEESLNIDCDDSGKLELVDWSLAEANADQASAVRSGQTLSRPLTVTLRLARPSEETIEQRLHLVDLPTMTNRASFVIRGRERVCIGQLVLAPGVYFSYKSRGQMHEARVVPGHGMPIRFDFGRDGVARVFLGSRKPMDVEYLLRALGWKGTAQEAGLPDDIFGGAEALSQAQAARRIGEALTSDPEEDPVSAFQMALTDCLGYSLGDHGRSRVNRRLGTTSQNHFLEPEDVLAILRKLVELRKGDDDTDDLNHMKNLVVRTVADSLTEHVRPTFHHIRAGIAASLSGEGTLDLQELLGTQLQDTLDDFFLRCSLVRTLNTTNYLAMVAQARQITRTGPGGLDRNRTGLPARYVHPSQYGRVCVIDTPEGQNLGLLRSLGMYTKLDEHGFVLAPYLRVSEGRVTKEVVFLPAEEDDEHMLAAGDSPRDAEGRLLGQKLMARHGYNYYEVAPQEVEFIGVSAQEILGAPAHTIPLINFDDTNRGLMGANMARQAVCLLNEQPPMVATGYEKQLAQSISSTDGEVAPGRNLLAAYLPWEGYNYEDGLVVSERVLKEEAFSSMHVREFAIETHQAAQGAERFTNELPDTDPEFGRHLGEDGVVRIGEEVRSGDVLVGKVKHRADGGAEELSLRMPHGCEGRVIDTEYQARSVGFELPTGVEERVRVTVAVKRTLKVGDKLANRHGAKGIAAVIVPEEDMPCLPDGTPVDLVCDPLGVPSRMNIGQLMEAHLSLAAGALGVQVISPHINGATPDDVSALLREAGLPEDGRLQLHDGRTGRPFDQRSTVGYVYWRKLDHMVDDAFQARSTGAYVPATQQPVHGRKRVGGQKVGKMEIWALQSHGAAHNLREFLSIKADDAVGRKRIYEAIVEGREEEAFRAPESANLLLRELRAVGLDAGYLADGKPVNVDEPYDISRVNEVRIAFASPDAIRSWSNGEITADQAFDEETGEPVADGLFCERIFGPLRAFQCACGKLRGTDRRGETCDDCAATVLDWQARFRRMGHIELAAPALHPWLLKAEPNPLGAFLGLDREAVEDVIYCRKYVVLDPRQTGLARGQLLDDDEYRAAREKFGYEFPATTGAEAIAKLLETADLEAAKARLLATATPENRTDVAEAVALLDALGPGADACRQGVLTAIPVLPAGLRPAMRLGEVRTATSDLNELYERVMKRNNRLKSLLAMKTPDIMLRDEQRLLQEAVSALFGNGYRGHSMRGFKEMTLAALSDRLKGPKGRFVQGLAGKRTDYSARTVIAPGTSLALDECGVPKELALEVFRPFVVAELLRSRKAKSQAVAERLVDRQREEAYRALKKAVRDKVVLLVRAPALHKYSMLAFRPVLTNERVIRLHPNVTIGFNADYDGDQMTIHVPLSRAAHEEAKRVLMAPRNLFGTASGAMMNRPSQDIVLGSYYMTLERAGAEGEGQAFPSALAARNAWKAGRLDAHARIRVTMDGSAVETTVGRLIFNDLLPEELGFIDEAVGIAELQRLIADCYLKCGVERTAELVDAVKNYGFHYATTAGLSIWRREQYHGLAGLLAETDAQVEELRRQREAGELDERQCYVRTIDLWSEFQSRITTDVTLSAEKLTSTRSNGSTVYRCTSTPSRLLTSRGGPQAVRTSAKAVTPGVTPLKLATSTSAGPSSSGLGIGFSGASPSAEGGTPPDTSADVPSPAA